MSDLLAQGTARFGDLLPLALLVHLRLLGCLMTLPGLGERSLPVRMRVALAVALTPLFLGLPLQAAQATAPQLLAASAAELVVGIILGLTVRLTAATLSIAATAIASTASLAQLIGGENEMAPHPVGNLLHLAGLAALMALGFPVMLADYLAAGFAAWPLGALPDPTVLLPAVVRLIADGFSLALILASPFILGGFLYQALGGVVGRVMPALPVVFVGAPLAILLALIGLALLAAPIIATWADAVLDSVPLLTPP